MNSNFLDNLEDLVEQAVNDTFGRHERMAQKQQSNKIDKNDLRASKLKEKDLEEEEENDDVTDEDLFGDKASSETKRKQSDPKLTGDPKKVARKVAAREKAAAPPGTPTSKSLRNLTDKELKKADFNLIAQNINLLRGGKSIKDNDVRMNLKAYVEKLSPLEKKEVLIYLNSLAQVMSGMIAGDDAVGPNHSSLSGANEPEAARSVDSQKTKLSSPVRKTSAKPGVIVVGAS